MRTCKDMGIHVMAFSNLGGASYVAIGMADESDSCMSPQVVKDAAAKHGKSAGQVVLKWGIQRGNTIIPKTAKKERLAENAGLFDWELTAEEMESIDALNKNKRYNTPAEFCERFFKVFVAIHE